MSLQPASLAPVRHEVVVPVDPAEAFRLYVTRPGRTHPTEGLSGSPTQIVYEPRVGGRWFEVDTEGGEHEWGRVLAWDPPHRLRLAWMVTAVDGDWVHDPDPERSSTAEITFSRVDGGTLVRVEHAGFERHGAGGAGIRRGATGGWAEDLHDLARAVGDARPAQGSARSPDVDQDRGITGVQVNLYCEDVERSAHFFEGLGMSRVFVWPQSGPAEKIEVEAAGVRVGLDSIEAANRIAGLGLTTDPPHRAEVALWTEDVDALFTRALANRGQSLVRPERSHHGRLRWAWVLTPEGHVVKLVQSLPAS